MLSRRDFLSAAALAGAASSMLPRIVWAANDSKTVEQMVSKAIGYLTTKGQAEDGSYTAASGPGITALVVAGILRNGRSSDDPAVAKSLKYLEGFVQPDGGIYAKESYYKNYETCIAILALTEANKNGRYDKILKKADAFVKGEQWDESEGKNKDDVFYGGAGYGRSKRPDLSNTTFLIDALKATGNDENSEAIQRALIFVSRCQNLETEHNTTPFAAKNPDGGFYYTPAGSGNSQAGLFYYYNTFAKALSAMGQDEFIDEKGVKHDWRKELIAALASRQREDGSWVNGEKKWLEGDANIVTAYALLALSYCKRK
jgi:squalene-hopene/tetraprenyl-beta-curcumene cyclase